MLYGKYIKGNLSVVSDMTVYYTQFKNAQFRWNFALE